MEPYVHIEFWCAYSTHTTQAHNTHTPQTYIPIIQPNALPPLMLRFKKCLKRIVVLQHQVRLRLSLPSLLRSDTGFETWLEGSGKRPNNSHQADRECD